MTLSTWVVVVVMVMVMVPMFHRMADFECAIRCPHDSLNVCDGDGNGDDADRCRPALDAPRTQSPGVLVGPSGAKSAPL